MINKKSLEEIELEMNSMFFDLTKRCKIEYYEWRLEDKMHYGRLMAMKQRRLAEQQHKENQNA
jgi:hypothetical protein